MQSPDSGRTLTFAKAVNEALAHELSRDDDVVLLGEDIGPHGGVFGATAGLHERFGGKRVVDMPISEAGFLGMAIGAATRGTRPVVELMFMDFALVAADQLWNQAAKLRFLSGDQLRMPLTIRTQQGVGMGTAAQHSQCFEALFAHIPGFAVALPSTPADAKGLLASAIRSDDPTIVIEHKALYGTKGIVPEGDHVVPLGKAAVRRTGADVTLISYSRSMQIVDAAAHELEQDGIGCEVIDVRTVVPLDIDTILESVAKTGAAIVVHEASRSFGVGAELAAQITQGAWSHLRAPVLRVCGLDAPVPYAETLESAWLPTSAHVVSAAHRVLEDRHERVGR